MKITFSKNNIFPANSTFTTISVGILICCIFVALSVGGLYLFLNYEAKRIDDFSSVDIKMPLLDKDGLNYFIARQKQRAVLNAIVPPAPATPAASAKKK